MTDILSRSASTAGPTAPQLGHPVRSFTLMVVGIGLVLLAVQAAGIVLPRVTNAYGEASSGSGVGDREWSAAVITNEGLLSVHIDSVTWPTTGATETQVEVLPPGTTVPGTLPSATPVTSVPPFTLNPGERRVVVVSGRAACTGSFGTGELTVRAHGLSRLHRDLVVRPAEPTDVSCALGRDADGAG